MQAWKLFSHSVLQIIRNLKGVLLITFIPFIILSVPIFIVVSAVPHIIDGAVDNPSSGMFVRLGPFGRSIPFESFPSFIWLLLFSLAFAGIVSLWAAVAWHRFILLNEPPQNAFSKKNLLCMASYFKTLILLTIIIILIFFVTSILSPFVLAIVITPPIGAKTILIMILLSTLFSAVFWTIFLRLCPALPAAALREDVSFFDGYTETRGATITFFIMGIAFTLASMSFDFLLDIIPVHLFALIQIFEFVAAWLAFVFNLSLVTTLYGHYVEKRALV
tara:strand:- start:1 stop:828 length:828 start_codon:yes stop_codon:yes gene_type:complete